MKILKPKLSGRRYIRWHKLNFIKFYRSDSVLQPVGFGKENFHQVLIFIQKKLVVEFQYVQLNKSFQLISSRTKPNRYFSRSFMNKMRIFIE